MEQLVWNHRMFLKDGRASQSGFPVCFLTLSSTLHFYPFYSSSGVPVLRTSPSAAANQVRILGLSSLLHRLLHGQQDRVCQ